jgi:aminoglycoside 3-N-acetyltransferase I
MRSVARGVAPRSQSTYDGGHRDAGTIPVAPDGTSAAATLIPVAYAFKLLASSDLTFARDLMKVFSVAFDQPDEYQGRLPTDEYLAGLIGRPHIIVMVALDDACVVGGLVAYVLEKLEQERSEVYIYDLAVLEEHRRRGLATGLIRSLGTVAKQRGAGVMFVQADRGDAPAIALYESLGTREDVHHFDIPVD